MRKIKTILLSMLFFVPLACSSTNENIPEVPGKTYAPEITTIASYTTNIVLEWEGLPDASKYEVEYAQTEKMVDPISLESRTANVDIKNLQKSQSYFIRIRALTPDGWTEWSNPSTMTTASFEAVVTSYNILGVEADENVEPEFAWHLRKDVFKNMVLQENNNADIVGFQETRTLAEDLVEMFEDHYEGHVSSREVSARLICWKPEKFELVSYDDDVDVFGAEVSGRNTARYPTQVRLREKATGKELLVYNVHLPAGSNVPREEAQWVRSVGAKNLAQHIKQEAGNTGLPVIVMGDFNNYPETVIEGNASSCIILKEAGFEDTFDKAQEKTNINYSTTVNRVTSSVKPGEKGSARIDYIFTYPKGKMAVTKYDILINFEPGSSSRLQKPVPSDHHPVRSVLHFVY